MEYRLPTLFESLSETDRTSPLNTIDKGLRNQIIVDMMNSGILQFTQAAVDEVVKNVDTKEKLDGIYRKVKDIKEKAPKRVLPPGATLVVDTLPDGSLPVLNTKGEVDFFEELIYKGLDIDKSVNNTPYMTEQAQAKTPAPSKETLEEKKSEIKERIASNSFGRPGMPAPRQLVTPNDFTSELLDMGVFHSSFEEQDQYVKFISWAPSNYDSLRNFIKVFRKCKDPEEKKILIPAIKEVLRDINASKMSHYSDAFNGQNLLNRLVNCNIFLTSKEKETFAKWDNNERCDLERMITNHEFSKVTTMPDALAELESANNIRDYILKLNRTKEQADHEAVLKEIQEGDPIKSPTIRRTIKDMVHKLRVWGVIENNAEACDTQYNKCMKWSQRNIENIERELNKISEGVLLFEALTNGQMEFLRASVNYYNDFPNATMRISAPLVSPPSFTSQPLQGFEVLKTPSMKYNDQFTTLTTPGVISYNGDIYDNGITLKAPSINLESPNIQLNGQKIDTSKLMIQNEDYLVIKRNPEVVQVPAVTKEDLSAWKDIWSGVDIGNPEIYHHVYPDPFTADMFDWEMVPTLSSLVAAEVPKQDSQFVGEIKKAGVRVAATQLNKVTKGVLATALPGDQSTILQQFLDSELGTSFVSMINGMALTYALPDNERAQVMAKEFRISSLTTAGNFAVEEILELISSVVAESLTDNISKSIKESDDEEEIELGYEDFIEEKVLKA